MPHHTSLVVPNSYSAQVHLPELYLLEWIAETFGVDTMKLRADTYLRNCSYKVYKLYKNPDVDWAPPQNLFIQGLPAHSSILLRSVVFLQWLSSRLRYSHHRYSVVVVESIYKTARPELSLYQNLYPFWLRYRLVNNPIDARKMRRGLVNQLRADYGRDLSNVRLGNLPKSVFSHFVDFYAQSLHGFCFAIPPDVQPPNFSLRSNLIVTSAESLSKYHVNGSSFSINELSVFPQSCFIESVVSHDIGRLANGNPLPQQTTPLVIGEMWDDDDDSDEDLEGDQPLQYLQDHPSGYTQKDIKNVPSYADESKGYVACQGSVLLVNVELIQYLTTLYGTPDLMFTIVQLAKPCAHERFASLLSLVDLSTIEVSAGTSEIMAGESIVTDIRTDLGPSKIYLCLMRQPPPPMTPVACSDLLFLAHLYTYL